MFGFLKKKKKINTYYKWERPKYLLPPIETLSYRGKIKKEQREEVFENTAKAISEAEKQKNTQHIKEPRLRYEWFQPKSVIPPIETLIPTGVPSAVKPKIREEVNKEEIKKISEKPTEKQKKQPKNRYVHGNRRIDYSTACELTPKTLKPQKEEKAKKHEIESKTEKAVQKQKIETVSSTSGRTQSGRDINLGERRKTEDERRNPVMVESEDEIETHSIRSSMPRTEHSAVNSQRTARRQTIRESEMAGNSIRRQNRRPY